MNARHQFIFTRMRKMNGLLANYQPVPGTLDEAYSSFPSAYVDYHKILRTFDEMQLADFKRLNESAKLSFLNQGITYAVYSEEGGGTEKIFPFDLFPRVIDGEEWNRLEQGLEQRNLALNMFVKDIYSHGRILKDKIIPTELVL
ncbi:MAG: circularly permuted type 2 ATP-grasp protein, partial [Bacteroidota bacterium]